MSEAAGMPCPTTSPMANANWPSGNARTSYQSPPTSTSGPPATYRLAMANPGSSGSTSGIRLCWRVSAAVRWLA